MESQKTTNPEEQIRSALTLKWPKLSSPEVKEIIANHDKLSAVLKRRYSLSRDDAQKESTAFFKPFDEKRTIRSLKH